MADIINLKRARKHKARAEKDKAAQTNRTLYGTAKIVRNTAKTRERQATDRLDGKKLDTLPE